MYALYAVVGAYTFFPFQGRAYLKNFGDTTVREWWNDERM
jgi:hypothetical protein